MAEQVNRWPAFAVNEKPDPVVSAAFTAIADEHVSVPGPLSLTALAKPVAVLPLTPANEETVQLIEVEPPERIEVGESDADVEVSALLIVTAAHVAADLCTESPA